MQALEATIAAESERVAALLVAEAERGAARYAAISPERVAALARDVVSRLVAQVGREGAS